MYLGGGGDKDFINILDLYTVDKYLHELRLQKLAKNRDISNDSGLHQARQRQNGMAPRYSFMIIFGVSNHQY